MPFSETDTKKNALQGFSPRSAFFLSECQTNGCREYHARRITPSLSFHLPLK